MAQIAITLGGIDFDCEYSWVDGGDEDSSYAMLEAARVKGVDIIEILAEGWIFAMEDEIEKTIRQHNEDAKLDRDLYNNEAYGI